MKYIVQCILLYSINKVHVKYSIQNSFVQYICSTNSSTVFYIVFVSSWFMFGTITRTLMQYIINIVHSYVQYKYSTCKVQYSKQFIYLHGLCSVQQQVPKCSTLYSTFFGTVYMQYKMQSTVFNIVFVSPWFMFGTVASTLMQYIIQCIPKYTIYIIHSTYLCKGGTIW